MKDNIACNWTTKYRSIIGWGRIFIIEDHEEKIKGLDVIMAKYGSKGRNNYSRAPLDKMVLLVIKIEKYAGKQSGDW